MSRKICFCVGWLLLVGQVGLAQSPWEWQSPVPQGNTLQDVQMFPDGNGIATGGNGTLMRTLDGGVTWSVLYGCDNGRLIGSSFVSPVVGWAIWTYWDGQRDAIEFLHTADEGATWTRLPLPDSARFSDVLFLNEQVGFVTGSRGYYSEFVARTTDAGDTWQEQLLDSVFGTEEIFFLDDLNGWIAGYGGMVRTTNGGESWMVLSRDFENSISEVQFFDELNGVGIGGRYFYRTRNGGVLWSSITLSEGTTGPFTLSLHFVSSSTGWIVGSGGWIIATTDGGTTWIPQASGVNDFLYRVAFTDPNHGVVMGDYGRILRTTDAGSSWNVQAGQRISDLNFYAVDFADTNYGWAVGGMYYGGRLIVRTTNGGNTWTALVNDPDSSAIVDVAALSPLTAWFAGGSSGLMLTTDGGQSFIPQFLPENRRAGQLQFFNADSGWIRSGRYLTYTTNGGQNWQAIPTMTMSGTYGMFFLDMQNGWVFGGKPATIEHTTDGGLTWTRQYQDSLYGETAVVGLSFTDPNVGWAAVWGLSLLHTTNGGATWNSVNIGGCGDWTTMQWTDPDHGYVLSDYEPMWYTTDAGTTWREAPNHIGSRMIDVDFPNASHGWVVGWNGTIVKWNGSALAAEPVARAAIPIQCMLSAFPNPFNPITTLEFTIPVTTRASLQVYDITGRLVQTLTDRVLPAGIYTQRLDASRLPSGVYFARLSAAGTDVTRKIVLIK